MERGLIQKSISILVIALLVSLFLGCGAADLRDLLERMVGSANGDKIAFSRGVDDEEEIYVMNIGGSGQTRLTNSPYSNKYPDWSPDKSKIAFSAGKPITDNEIFVMYADGTSQIQITDNGDEDYRADWSPDGTKIAFSKHASGNNEVYVMNANGSGQTQLIDYPTASDANPDWKYDGSKILFMSNRDTGGGPSTEFEIYVMDANGDNQTRLTTNTDDDRDPVWSPDGSRIVFQSDRDGNYEIYVMNADGSGQTRLTNNIVDDKFPNW
jgi:Tol biopolymer transport system component